MTINCFYDEKEQYPDIVYIPKEVDDVISLQEDFFKWVFDEEKSNAKFTEFAGMKGCSYNTENFVYWINEFFLSKKADKAYIVEKNASQWDLTNEKLFF